MQDMVGNIFWKKIKKHQSVESLQSARMGIWVMGI
jgi:hypothetical protein